MDSHPETPCLETPVPDGVPLTGTPQGQGTRDIPTEWISWRITTPYDSRIKSIFKGACYIASYEVSKKNVEHWHVLSIGHANYDCIKKRYQRDGEVSGTATRADRKWSDKNRGTFLGALAYTMKNPDNSIPGSRVIRSDDWPSFEYEKWQFRDSFQSTIKSGTSEKRKALSDWQLTYSNLVGAALAYHREHGMATSASLRDVVQDMMENTKWRPSPHMLKNGIHQFYKDDFEFRKGKKPRLDMSWFDNDPRTI